MENSLSFSKKNSIEEEEGRRRKKKSGEAKAAFLVAN